jgi:Cellobiose phosphorylase
MIIPTPTRLHTATCGALSLSINESGAVYKIAKNRLQLNAYKPASFQKGPFDLYLRFDQKCFSLFASADEICQYDNGFAYEGRIEGCDFRLEIILANESLYFFSVTLNGQLRGKADFVFVHDIGLSDEGAVFNNELYVSQYVDHNIVQSPYGYTILSRENMGKPNPGLAIGSYGLKVIHYASDLMQFYTPESRLSGIPSLLMKDLPDVNRQFELGAAILQSEAFFLNGSIRNVFYGLVSEDQPTPYISLPSDGTQFEGLMTSLQGEKRLLPKANLKAEFPFSPLLCQELSEKELALAYPARLQEEKKDGRLLSFFLQDGTHVVTRAKEVLVERPHGNILYRYPKEMAFEQDSFSLTTYMFGSFGAQIVVGNTSLNKLTPVNRGLLDLPHSLGMRLLLKEGGEYRLLGVPSLFEMGFNYSKWIYKTEADALEVTVYLAHSSNTMQLAFRSRARKNYDLILYFEAVVGEGERLIPFEYENENGVHCYHFAPDSYFASRYPRLGFELRFEQNVKKGQDGMFFEDGVSRLPSLQCFSLRGSSLTMNLTASLDEEINPTIPNFEREKSYFQKRLREDFSDFHLTAPGESSFAEKANLIVPWLASGALIHFLVPHGLEQTGGAAWGTRDVCQGPYELFSSVGNFPAMRKLLLEVFSHQKKSTGEWPQWFMLDKYGFAADDCHGDIVFWPLGILADYLAKTGDHAILEALIPSQNDPALKPLNEHLEWARGNIESRFIQGTDLLCYGGGDWDDTLQPCQASFKTRLVSPWTQELAYQVLERLSLALNESHAERKLLANVAQRLKNGYESVFVQEGEIPGFLYVEEDGSVSSFVDKHDEKTGIHCRLLPYTRAILSHLASPSDAHRFFHLIDEKLSFPDGVRLMDHPAHYDGGVSHMFVRAEQASNVGREISLCYIHADIRYAESATLIGEANKAFAALRKIIPINLQTEVPNANPRQANAYFSSSDPLFNDRYAFASGIEELRKGLVPVNGGWRVYSSGNGIFLARLISDFLGVRIAKDTLVLDPVLPPSFDGASLHLLVGGRPLDLLFHISRKTGVKKLLQNGKSLPFIQGPNPYRQGGAVVQLKDLKDETIEVFTN